MGGGRGEICCAFCLAISSDLCFLLHRKMIAAARAPLINPGKKPATTALAGNSGHVADTCASVVVDEKAGETAAVVVVDDGTDSETVAVAVGEAVDRVAGTVVAPDPDRVADASDEVDLSSTQVLFFAQE